MQLLSKYAHKGNARFAFMVLSMLLICACQKASDPTKEVSFTAEVVSISDNTMLVRPDDTTKEDKMSSQLYVPIDTTIINSAGRNVDASNLAVGTHVKITYDGVLNSAEPALVENCFQIQILNDDTNKT